MNMHNVSSYGGKRVPNTRFLTVQFPTKEKMEDWLKLMRKHYPSQEHFCPCVNKDKNIVTY
jgi:hypothetical protein